MTTATPAVVSRGRRGSRVVLLLRVLVVAALIGLWQLLTRGALKGTVAPPIPVVKELWSLLDEPSFHTSLWQTMSSWAAGLLISMVGGVAVGLLVGSVPAVYRSTSSLFDFLRAVPAIALIPLGVLVMGGNANLTIALVVLICIWPVLVQTTHAARAIDPMMFDVARVMRLRRGHTIRWMLMPAMLPYLGTALRLAAIMALMGCIGVQLIASVPGLGNDINANQVVNNVTTVDALVLVVAVIGIVVSQTFGWLEQRMLRWHVSEAGGNS